MMIFCTDHHNHSLQIYQHHQSLIGARVVEMTWHWFDIFMICTDIPNHPYKELGRDAEREKM